MALCAGAIRLATLLQRGGHWARIDDQVGIGPTFENDVGHMSSDELAEILLSRVRRVEHEMWRRVNDFVGAIVEHPGVSRQHVNEAGFLRGLENSCLVALVDPFFDFVFRNLRGAQLFEVEPGLKRGRAAFGVVATGFYRIEVLALHEAGEAVEAGARLHVAFRPQYQDGRLGSDLRRSCARRELDLLFGRDFSKHTEGLALSGGADRLRIVGEHGRGENYPKKEDRGLDKRLHLVLSCSFGGRRERVCNRICQGRLRCAKGCGGSGNQPRAGIIYVMNEWVSPWQRYPWLMQLLARRRDGDFVSSVVK